MHKFDRKVHKSRQTVNHLHGVEAKLHGNECRVIIADLTAGLPSRTLAGRINRGRPD